MNWYKIFYLFSLADKISMTMLILSIIFSAVCLIGIIAYGIGRTDTPHDRLPISWGMFKRTWIPALVCWFVWAFIPNRQDMTLIVAGGAVGQFIMNDDNAKALPADITRFLRAEILEATVNMSDDIKSSLNIKTRRDSLMEMSKDELIKMLDK